MSIKTIFTIKDLEYLSNIKAHTIRAWEKRYNLLHPMRTESNIRYYSTEHLKKILNISYLNANGFKISKLALLSEEELLEKVRLVSNCDTNSDCANNCLKLAMINFNESLFEETFQNLLSKKTFKSIFKENIIPFLQDVGRLWVTDTICPAQERFISTLIKRKILTEIERISTNTISNEKIYVLYLPVNEMHDIGILFSHYTLLLAGKKVLYAGAGISINDLICIRNLYDNITYVSCFTIQPTIEYINDYLQEFYELILKNSNNNLYVFGNNTVGIDRDNIPSSIQVFDLITDFEKNISK